MDTPTRSQDQVTILRIKRKRNEEPLDALVVESSSKRKKSKGGMNVFQFAETVEQEAWEDERKKEDLQSRIGSLAREYKKNARLPAGLPESASTSSNPPTEAVEDPSLRPMRKLPRIDDPSRKYTIVHSASAESTLKASRRATAPPKVHSYKELQKASFTMYDAIPSSTSLAAASSSSTSDHEIDKFLPMLEDYLKLTVSGADASLATSSSSGAAADDDDYVWDVFYSRPATFRELYGSNTNIGTVSGLPDEDSHGSDSDSEYEDEDDEDSNAEDWYKNDYPEEESASDEEMIDSEGSDEFHEDSDYEDLIHGSQAGTWDHR